MCECGLVLAERVAFSKEPNHVGFVAVMQLVGHISQTLGHTAKQRFDIQRILLDHRTRAIRVGQSHTGHIPPAASGQCGRNIAIGVGRQFVDQRGGYHVWHMGDHCRSFVVRLIVQHDETVANTFGNQSGHVKESLIIRGTINGHRP